MAKNAPRIDLAPEEVGEIMRGWLDHCRVGRLSASLADKMKFPFRSPIRALLDQRAPAAAQALWNDDFLRARELLLRHGLAPSGAGPLHGMRAQVGRNERLLRGMRIASGIGREYQQRSDGTHWKTVK
jgi:hypothetical protein